MKTTFSRTLAFHGLLLLTALLLVGISLQMLVKNYLADTTIEKLKSNSTTISQMASAYASDHTLSEKGFLINLSVAAQVSDTDTVICDENGKLLLCSDSPMGCEHRGLSITNRALLQQIFSQEHVVSTGMVEGLYTESRYVVCTAIRDSANSQPIGVVITSTPTAGTLATMRRLTDLYLVVAATAVFVAVMIMTVYAKKHSNPLRDMAKTATAFGHGDLQARAKVPDGSPEELQELALSFNNMAQSLEKSEYQRKEFVTNVSHELKTPMTTISGFVDGILDGTIPQDQQAHYLQIVSQETKRLSRLVRSMLDISQLQEQGQIPEEKKTRFDVGEAISRALLNFEQTINEKLLDVQVDLPEHPVYSFACEDYISQVFYNLIDNAVKFCKPGGRLGLRIVEGGGKLYLSVSNEGATIPPQELPLLFERFHKLDKSRSENRDGWGLGLYIVRTLISCHGENISVSSENGTTEFTFTLPQSN